MISEEDLTHEAIQFAQEYINKKFAGKDMNDVSIAVNSCAHGYFRGYRYSEKRFDRGVLKRMLRRPDPKPLDPVSLMALSEENCLDYIKWKKLEGASPYDKTLVLITVAYGFRMGVREHESEL